MYDRGDKQSSSCRNWEKGFEQELTISVVPWKESISFEGLFPRYCWRRVKTDEEEVK